MSVDVSEGRKNPDEYPREVAAPPSEKDKSECLSPESGTEVKGLWFPLVTCPGRRTPVKWWSTYCKNSQSASKKCFD